MKKKIDLNKFTEVVGQLKTAQKQLQSLVNKETMKEAKKYAQDSSQEIKKWIKNTDVKKVKSLIEKEAKELQKFQKQIPAELAKFSKYVDTQKKELEKVLKSVHALEAADYIQNKMSSTQLGKKMGLKKKTKKAKPASETAKPASETAKPAEAPVSENSNPT